jgi:hypothetical protein
MKSNKQLDAWAAEKLGFTVTDGGGVPQWQVFEGAWLQPFSLQDARCREIVREHFSICTIETVPNSEGDNWFSYVAIKSNYGEGKSIEEAEIACIAAIMEAEK